MISWNKLSYNLTALAKLPNGGGSEVEFTLNGKNYVLIHYRHEVTLTYYPDDLETSGKYVERTYPTMEELGAAKDFGFCLKDEWRNITTLDCRPSFDDSTLAVRLLAFSSMAAARFSAPGDAGLSVTFTRK